MYLEDLATLSKGGLYKGECTSRLQWNRTGEIVCWGSEGRGKPSQRCLDRLTPSGVADHVEVPVSGVPLWIQKEAVANEANEQHKMKSTLSQSIGMGMNGVERIIRE
jgi:hypothetical protein